MVHMNLQYFGGRGSAGGTNTGALGGSGSNVVESKSPEAAPKMSPKAQKVANNALKSLVFNGGYAEIASNQWSYAGMSNKKVVAALNTLDSKYSYELRTEQTKGLGAARNVTVTHYRIYRKRKSK